jgi:hypothetical protein
MSTATCAATNTRRMRSSTKLPAACQGVIKGKGEGGGGGGGRQRQQQG